MRRNQQRSLWLGVSILGVLTLSPALFAQDARTPEATIPVPSDWSHHHVIFSRPATAEQAKGMQQNARYLQQRYRRELPIMLPAARTPPKNYKLKRDWAESMGTGASVGAGNYPAKFSFLTTTANCGNATQPDFVVYSTGLTSPAGPPSQASIVAYDNLYSGCSGLDLATAANFAVLGASTVTNAGGTVVTGANIGISPGTSLTGFPPGILTPPAAQQLGNPVASQAQADANTAYTFYQGLSGAALIGPVLDGLTLTPGLYKAASTLALSAGATVTLNGNGTYIFQIDSALNLAGTVVLSGGATAGNVIWLVGSSATLEGTAVAAGNIVALTSVTLDGGASVSGRVIALNGAVTMIDNAVTTVDTVPSVYWAYDTAGQILTSPVFSKDGTQVAFAQTNGGLEGSLVLLKWSSTAPGTVSSPVVPTVVNAASYQTCTVPCMTSMQLTDNLNNPNDDRTSSVFYDYNSDTAYVGDALGWLHKFTPVFNGALLETRSGVWPIHLNAGDFLSSPVHDSASGNVFVGDGGGFLYRVNSTTGAVTTSGQLDFGVGIVEGPIVDSTFGLVYVFASRDDSFSCSSESTNCAAVYQLTTTFPSGDFGSEAKVGASTDGSTTPNPIYIGGFDSSYLNSANATGNLYVCGNTGANPTLYQIPITAGAFPLSGLGIPVTALTPASKTPPCSPVTDVYNANTSGGPSEQLFVSVQDNGISSGGACANGGCITNFLDTPWRASTAYTLGQEILSSKLHIEVAITVVGPSGAVPPVWSTSAGTIKVDNGVTWLDQGAVLAGGPPGWSPLHSYAAAARIVDINGNVQVVPPSDGGTSGTLTPVWSTTPGAPTSDGTVTWLNAGAIATFSLAAEGGASGVIIDNTVVSGTLGGTSQIYFSTLGDQVCSTSGTTGGCAVQASQSALQ
jgi:hypothetical protein